MKTNVLAYQEINGLRVNCCQEAHVGSVIFAIDRAKASNELGIVRNGHASKFLKFGQLAQCDFAPRAVLIARYVVIISTINEKANSVLAAEPNQFSERRLNGLRVFQPDDDVCVDEKLEFVHR